MESTNIAQPAPPTFRRRWWGYDREEVEEFLRQTAADRQRHQESLAWLDALMAGYDPQARDAAITAKRRESHHARIAALRMNAEGLAKAEPSGAHSGVALAMAAWGSLRSMSRPQVYALLAGALLCVSLLAMRGSGSGSAESRATANSEVRATPMTAGSQDSVAQFKVASIAVPATIPSDPRPADRPVPAVEQIPGTLPPVAVAEGLVVTLTAQRECWIGTTIDGGQRLERILKPDETFMLHAHEEVVLRVGDAGALSVLVNNQPMKPLGPSGQIATRRISRSNYLSLLAP